MKKVKCYELVSEDLTGVGGPMGTDHTTENFTKFFVDIENAKKYAEKDYGDKIEWIRCNGGVSSGDLLHVMYDITPVKTED